MIPGCFDYCVGFVCIWFTSKNEICILIWEKHYYKQSVIGSQTLPFTLLESSSVPLACKKLSNGIDRVIWQ